MTQHFNLLTHRIPFQDRGTRSELVEWGKGLTLEMRLGVCGIRCTGDGSDCEAAQTYRELSGIP